MFLKLRNENRKHWPWGLDKFRSESLFKFRCKSLTWMIIRRWLHLSKQGATTDLLFLLCSQWQGIHRKLCVCRCIDNNILRHWKAGSGCSTKQQQPTIAPNRRKVAITAQAVRVPWKRNKRRVNSMPCCALDLQWRRCLVVSYCSAACSWQVAETLILSIQCHAVLWIRNGNFVWLFLAAEAELRCRNARAQPG